MHHLISHTIFLPMWGLQILLFGLKSGVETEYGVSTVRGQ